MADDDELWGFGQEPEYQDSSEDERNKRESDLSDSPDYMLPDAKRKKLGVGGGTQRQRRAARAAAAAAAAAQQQDVVDLASDDDSDKQLLREAAAAAAGAGRRSTATSLPAPPPAWLRGAAPVLDARSKAMLRQISETQRRLDQAQNAELSDDSEELEPSPVVLAHRRQQAQQQQQQAGHGGVTDLTGDAGTPDSDAEAGGSGGEAVPPPAPAAPEGDRIQLKLCSSKGEKLLRMARTDPFSKLFEVYRRWAVEQGHLAAGAAPRFVFDGEPLRGDDTPAAQDLEGDEIIEVHF